jgi:hypothetical protein
VTRACGRDGGAVDAVASGLVIRVGRATRDVTGIVISVALSAACSSGESPRYVEQEPVVPRVVVADAAVPVGGPHTVVADAMLPVDAAASPTDVAMAALRADVEMICGSLAATGGTDFNSVGPYIAEHMKTDLLTDLFKTIRTTTTIEMIIERVRKAMALVHVDHCDTIDVLAEKRRRQLQRRP